MAMKPIRPASGRRVPSAPWWGEDGLSQKPWTRVGFLVPEAVASLDSRPLGRTDPVVVPGPLEWWDQRTLTAGLSRPAAGVGVGAWIWEMGKAGCLQESITASTEAGTFGSRRTRGSVFPTTAER